MFFEHIHVREGLLEIGANSFEEKSDISGNLPFAGFTLFGCPKAAIKMMMRRIGKTT